MFNIAEYQQKLNRLTDLLPWAALVAPGVVLGKDGSFIQTVQYRGPDLESSTEEQLVAMSARVNNVLKRLGSGWAVFVEARRQHIQSYPEQGCFPDPVSWLVDTERRDAFEREGEHFESVYFLTFQYLPPKDAVNKLSRFFVNKSSKRSSYHKSLSYFTVQVARMLDIIKDFMFEVSLLTDAQTLTYYHSCISDKRHPVAVPEVPMYLDAILPDAPLTGGLEPKLGHHHIRTISILSFPGHSVPAILEQLNLLAMEYRWVTRYLPLDKLEAEKILKTYRRQWFAKRKGVLTLLTESFAKSESAMVDTGAIRQSQDADAALQELSGDYVSFGYYTATITVWDADQQAAYDKARAVERVINGLGFTAILETTNAVDAWLSSLPGHSNANVRMPLLHSLNLSHLIPLSSVWAGQQRDEHLQGPPLLYAQTTGNTPFRLTLHLSDVGHHMIIGPTGAGKSVLLAVMALQFCRYQQAQVVVFDKGGSFQVPTMLADGAYYQVGGSAQSGLTFQPLAHIDDPDELVWASEWVGELMLNEGVEMTPQTKEVIWQGLTALANAPQQQRTITGLQALIQDHDLRLALHNYTLQGPFGQILDAQEQNLQTRNWQCFELEQLMNTPSIVPPVLSYLFHLMASRFDGRPTLLILDEAWLFLDHTVFASKIREWLKTLRKKNVSVVFATQSVADVLDSDIANTLIESCSGRIYLPNDRAQEQQVRQCYQHLGLNDRQIEMLANAASKRQYYYVSQLGNSLFDLNLGPLALAVCGAQGLNDRQLIQRLADENQSHLDLVRSYLQQQGLDWAWHIIEQMVV